MVLILLIGLIIIRKMVESCYTIRENIASNLLATDKKPIERLYAGLNLVN